MWWITSLLVLLRLFLSPWLSTVSSYYMSHCELIWIHPTWIHWTLDIYICHSSLWSFQQLFLQKISLPFSAFIFLPNSHDYIGPQVPHRSISLLIFLPLFFFFSFSHSINSNVLSLSSLISSSACSYLLLNPSNDFFLVTAFLTLEFLFDFFFSFYIFIDISPLYIIFLMFPHFYSNSLNIFKTDILKPLSGRATIWSFSQVGTFCCYHCSFPLKGA